jgi:hypothetical protein
LLVIMLSTRCGYAVERQFTWKIAKWPRSIDNLMQVMKFRMVDGWHDLLVVMSGGRLWGRRERVGGFAWRRNCVANGSKLLYG